MTKYNGEFDLAATIGYAITIAIGYWFFGLSWTAIGFIVLLTIIALQNRSERNWKDRARKAERRLKS